MQLLRSALVFSLSMLSVSAINITGVFRCPGLADDVKAKEVVEKVDSITIKTEKTDWYNFEENGVKYQYHHLFMQDDPKDSKDIMIAVNEDKSLVKVSIFHGGIYSECLHIPAEDTENPKGMASKGSVSRVQRK
ncbi:BgTH12-03501 [Blumeria graminis f. sp. triticale]|uniref:BgtE-5836 n=4 Tax=Blumeria graminis TaxID=34373 RepID=A0A9X9PR28_BLUGR|nr:putative secreted effector protein [Blumeria graminis f. sp. tritici 96224]CAD6499385.1 BgTH12-03501 [Blumeria graminis f. sp. triticale]VCU39535.1 BgtE-5836 [Blumeria graminis f. sp. tritici]